ncbi:MAG: hypothetical protein KHW49_02870 [Eubacterium sp.]|jgi:hypothetical protein|nr:hypothetical protein [Eubacterium sp.]
MKLPELQTIPSSEIVLDAFNGINDNIYIPEGYFKDMKNMSSDYYPALGQRQIRETYKVMNKLNGAITINGSLYACVKDKMYKDGKEIEGLTLKNNKKTLIGYGAYILIWPDKVMYNTEDNSIRNMGYELDIDAHSNTTSYLYISDKDGVPYEIMPLTSDYELSSPDGDKHVENFQNNVAWKPGYVDSVNALTGSKMSLTGYTKKRGGKYKIGFCPLTSEHKIAIEYYNPQMEMWSTPALYVTWRINVGEDVAKEIESTFKVGDFIKLEVCNVNGEHVSKESNAYLSEFYEKLNAYNKIENVVRKGGDIGIVLSNTGIDYLGYIEKRKLYSTGQYSVNADSGSVELLTALTLASFYMQFPRTVDAYDYYTLKVKKEIPDMDYMTVSENRVWGCSSSKHEIYACKLGDPTSWYAFSGISSDSYTVTVGSDGEFTGACTYKGMPYFFKENLIICMYGSKPSNYQLNEIHYPGIEKGSSQSIFFLGGLMYFKSRIGVVRFDGSSTQLISEELGGKKIFKNAIAAAGDEKYFISMQEGEKNHLYVYDSNKGMWHREDDLRPDYFFKFKSSVYAVSGQKIYRIDGLDEISSKLPDNVKSKEIEDYEKNGDFKIYGQGLDWYAETGLIESGTIKTKYIQRLGIRFELADRAEFSVKVKYDNEDEWQEIYTKEGRKNEGAISITFRPRRCEKFRIRFEGKGKCLIYHIQRTVNEGSDMHRGNF